MKNVMYAAIASAAISIGVVAIGIGKSANAYGDFVTLSGSLNEIPTVRTLLDALDLSGRVVTLDAMHTQDATARRWSTSDYLPELMTCAVVTTNSTPNGYSRL